MDSRRVIGNLVVSTDPGTGPVLTTSIESKIERAIDQLKTEAGEQREAWRDDATKHLNQALDLVRGGRIKPVEV